jgi:16S rRNA (uracil1498-N3)-methyltransferase
MALPLFFYDNTLSVGLELKLDEETARHIVQVLRMQEGDHLELTNGKGQVASVSISKAEKKRCSVLVKEVKELPSRKTNLHLAVAFTKNTSRNEWLLEKATELGAISIIPILAVRTERERIRHDRWSNIIIAALIQSRQFQLPELTEATPLTGILQRFNGTPQKIIGHCIESEQRLPLSEAMKPALETIVLIGPEGDFTLEEVNLCKQAGFIAVEMGKQRLRTETAAMAACAYFNLINHEA